MLTFAIRSPLDDQMNIVSPRSVREYISLRLILHDIHLLEAMSQRNLSSFLLDLALETSGSRREEIISLAVDRARCLLSPNKRLFCLDEKKHLYPRANCLCRLPFSREERYLTSHIDDVCCDWNVGAVLRFSPIDSSRERDRERSSKNNNPNGRLIYITKKASCHCLSWNL